MQPMNGYKELEAMQWFGVSPAAVQARMNWFLNEPHVLWHAHDDVGTQVGMRVHTWVWHTKRYGLVFFPLLMLGWGDRHPHYHHRVLLFTSSTISYHFIISPAMMAIMTYERVFLSHKGDKFVLGWHGQGVI